MNNIEQTKEAVEYDRDKIYLSRTGPIIQVFIPRFPEEKIRFNLKNKKLERVPKKGTQEYKEVKHLYHIFTYFSLRDIVSEEEKFLNLINLTKKLNPLCNSVSTFLTRMNDALIYENYINEGIPYDEPRCYYTRDKCYNKLEYGLEKYNKDFIKFMKKYQIKFNNDIEDWYFNEENEVVNIVNLLDSLEIDEVEVVKTFRDIRNSSHTFKELVKNYKYERKSLINYIVNYAMKFEGLSFNVTCTYLRDYYQMSSAIGRNVKKYPKFLASVHGIIQANYNAFQQEYDELRFTESSKPELEWVGKNFCVVIPKESKDILKEGTYLNHCVSSYVKSVISGHTYIMFLRSKENPDIPLVTLEFKNGKIVQAKGACNRAMKEEEKEALKKYTEVKKLELAVVL